MDNHEEYQEHDDEIDSDEEEAAYEDSVLNMPDPETVAKVSSAFNRDGTVRKIVKASKSDFVHNLLYLDGQKFSFAGREYLQPLYNRNDKRVMLKTGRQVEKCLIKSTRYLRFDGSEITVADLFVGDKLISVDDSFASTVDTVKSISPNGVKPVVRITTKKKRSVTCTLNHPFRTLLDWVDAGDLKVGDFIGLPHKAGEFGTVSKPAEAEFLGLMIAEGHIDGNAAYFTQAPGPVLDRVVALGSALGAELNAPAIPSKPTVRRVRFSAGTWELFDLVAPHMANKKSADHTIPEWIFQADRDTARAFIRGLWAGDGHCKNVRDGKIDLCFGSISKQLVDDLSRLLLKFGVLSTTRENKPTLYKGTDKVAYILRIIGAKSLKRFHDDVGPIPGKPFTLEKSCGDKDQSDIIPKEVTKLIKAIIKERGPRKHGGTLHTTGLRSTPKYNLQRDKFLRYCEALDDRRLWDIYNADIYWDAIESIEELPPEETIAVEMETYHNFVTDGVITHNSTALANNLVVSSVIEPYSKSLYVSPSHTQTRQFSNEKLRPAIEKSPLIAKYFQDSSVSSQVFEKGFTNGSYIFLRSAFRSADRTRGIAISKYLCVGGDTRLQVEGVGSATIEELGQSLVGKRVLTLNEETGAVEYDRVVAFAEQPLGKRRLMSIQARSGRNARVTEDHKVLTWRGWVEARNLTLGDYVLETAVPLCDESDFTEDEAFFLGYILGDGCHQSMRSCSVGTTDKESFEKVCDISNRLGFSYSVTTTTRNSNLSGKLLSERRLNFHASKDGNACERLLQKAGILGQDIGSKAIPLLNRLDRKCAVRLLEALLATDGCIHSSYRPENENSPIAVGLSYSSVSPQLAQDVATLFRMLGATSVKFYESAPSNSISKRTQYRVNCRTFESVSVLLSGVESVPGKDRALQGVRKILDERCKGTRKDDIVPLRGGEVKAQLIAALKSNGESLQGFYNRTGMFVVNTSRLSRQTAKEVSRILGDASTLSKLEDGLLWTELTGVSEVPASDELSVFDITLEKNHNFLGNSMILHNCIDEVQDFIGSEIPVILECTSHYPDACVIMAGTPKSHDNPIEMYWKETSQNEWLVPCKACGKWNFLDEKNIAPTEWYVKGKLPPGPICKKCMKPINVRDGRWVATSENRGMIGYRIPQLMVPWIVGLSEQWAKLLWKRDNYPFGQFCNEALGLSYDSASKPITRDEVISCCRDYDMWDANNLTDAVVFEAHKHLLTAGVDWGEGNDGSEKGPGGKTRNASYTILTIGTYVNQKDFQVKLVKKYMGREVEPDYVVKDIADICAKLRVKLIGADWGHGWGVNNQLVRRFGPQNVIQFQYLPKLKLRMKWDPAGFRYHLQRNFMMSEMFFDLKQESIQFPRWAQIEPYAKDILAIHAEYSEYRREIKYDHKSTDPDDFFHSLHYCKLASDIMSGRSRRYTQEIIDKDEPQ